MTTTTDTHVHHTGQDGIVEVTIDGTTHRIAFDDVGDPNNPGWLVEESDGWQAINQVVSDEASDAELIAMVGAEVPVTGCDQNAMDAIREFRARAVFGDDDAQIGLCDRAVGGDGEALTECLDVIAAAAAMAEEDTIDD